MDSVEAEGSSIDAAIDSALRMLGTTRDRVEVEILSNAARGLFGIGSRKARIRATLRKPIDADIAAPEPVPARAAPAAGSTRAVQHAREVLQDIVNHMGVEATVTASEDDDQISLELTGDTSGILIGRRGQMLDALEYVVNRIVSRDDAGSARISVDSQQYRLRRRESLEELARRMGMQAKRKGKAVTLNPMSPRDRRIVHLVLQDDTALVTKSSGKGYFRKLIIIPAGAVRPRRGDAPA